MGRIRVAGNTVVGPERGGPVREAKLLINSQPDYERCKSCRGSFVPNTTASIVTERQAFLGARGRMSSLSARPSHPRPLADTLRQETLCTL